MAKTIIRFSGLTLTLVGVVHGNYIAFRSRYFVHIWSIQGQPSTGPFRGTPLEVGTRLVGFKMTMYDYESMGNMYNLGNFPYALDLSKP